MSYISCIWSLCGSAGGEVRASTLTDPQFLSSRIKSVLAKITENFWSPTVQVFHEWFSSSFLPQSKIMPVRLIGHSKLALGLIVWEKFVCFLWWPPVQGVFLPFTQWLLGQSPAPTVTLIGTKQWLIEIGWTDGWKSYATGIPPASRRWPSMGWGFGSGAEITWLWTCMDAEPPPPPLLGHWLPSNTPTENKCESALRLFCACWAPFFCLTPIFSHVFWHTI